MKHSDRRHSGGHSLHSDDTICRFAVDARYLLSVCQPNPEHQHAPKLQSLIAPWRLI